MMAAVQEVQTIPWWSQSKTQFCIILQRTVLVMMMMIVVVDGREDHQVEGHLCKLYFLSKLTGVL